MSMQTFVTSTCLRYIVPFTYTLGFDEACALVDRQQEERRRSPGKYRKLWNRCTVSGKHPESDLYDFIREEFLFVDEEQPQTGNKMGARWIFHNSRESSTKQGGAIEVLKCIDPSLLKGFARASEEEQRNIFQDALKLEITNLGLLLFRNGLGMIWYELEPDTEKLESRQLVRMQNLIKELNRANAAYLWRCGRGNPQECSVVYGETGRGASQYAVPFSLARWLADRTGFLPKKYLVERKSSWPSLTKTYEKLLKNCRLPVVGFEPGQLAGEQFDDAAPDKAVLFTYCTFIQKAPADAVPQEDDVSAVPEQVPSGERYRLAYNLTNGYTDSYDCSPDNHKEMRQPFVDAIWYATSEGAGYYKWPNDSNRSTFENVIRTKASTDYFSMFVKALSQSYTLMLLAKQIHDEIPATGIEEMNDADYEKIGRKYEEVNQFLTKSIVTSVSHIHHQSDFYIYLKKQLRIDEDARSVSTGLEALDALQKEKRHRMALEKRKEEQEDEKRRDNEEKRRDNNLQEVMGIFSLLAIASAFVDCFDFIAKFSGDSEDGWSSLSSSPKVMAAEIFFCILIFIISVYAIYFIVKNRRDRKRQV